MQSWYIIDANVFLNALRYEVVATGTMRDPAYAVIKAYLSNRFVWVYSEDILQEYEYQFHKLRRNVAQSNDKRHFDTKVYNASMLAIRQGSGMVDPTELQLDEAYTVMMDPGRAGHLQDPHDCIYLAAADAARERGVAVQVLVSSDDSDLYTLQTYKRIPIMRSTELLAVLNSV